MMLGTIAALAVLPLGGCASRGDAQPQAEAVVAPAPPEYPSGTIIAGLDVSGMTEADARRELVTLFGLLPQRTLRLTYGQWSAPRTLGELGVRADLDGMLAEGWRSARVPLRLSQDLAAAKASIRRAARALDRPAAGARFLGAPGKSGIREGHGGRKVNIAASAEQVRMSLEQDFRTPAIPLVVEDLPAPSTPDDLATIRTVVARYTTRYNPRERNRTHNLVKVAQRLDGAWIAPGETFSFNETVGERRASEGFLEAIVYRDGVQVKETAGGLCQVSSTLYNVALLAGLPIVERNNHSLTVSYVPAGRDATVYWGAHDLRFTNDLDTPLYIRTLVGRGRLTIEAWGSEPPARKVSVWSTATRQGSMLHAVAYRRISEAGSARVERLSSDRYDTVHRTGGR
jgi:vancomycin resistance protein YoaR